MGKKALNKLLPKTCLKFSNLFKLKPFLSGSPLLINTAGLNVSKWENDFLIKRIQLKVNKS